MSQVFFCDVAQFNLLLRSQSARQQKEPCVTRRPLSPKLPERRIRRTPLHDGLVQTPREETRAVECKARGFGTVPREGPTALATLRIPHLDGPVPTSREETRAVQHKAPDSFSVPREGPSAAQPDIGTHKETREQTYKIHNNKIIKCGKKNMVWEIRRLTSKKKMKTEHQL